MKILRKYCDRCKGEISSAHEDVSDSLRNQYPGMDICPDCDLLITLSNSLSASDLIAGSTPGTSAKKMLDMYQSSS